MTEAFDEDYVDCSNIDEFEQFGQAGLGVSIALADPESAMRRGQHHLRCT